MKRQATLIAVMLTILVSLLPAAGILQAATGPGGAAQYVPEKDIIEMMGHMSYAQSADFLAHLEAASELLPPVYADISDALGSPVNLPDFTALRIEYEANIQAVYASKTVAEAQQKVGELARSAEAVKTEFLSLPVQMTQIAMQLQEKGLELEKKLRTELIAEGEKEQSRITADINVRVQKEVDAFQLKMQNDVSAYIASLLSSNDPKVPPNPGDIQAKVTAFVNERVDAFQKEMSASVSRWAKEAYDESQKRIMAKADEVGGPLLVKLNHLRDSTPDIALRIESLAQEKRQTYEAYREKFTAKQRALIEESVDAQFGRVEEVIHQYASDLGEARARGLVLPTAEELLARLEAGKEELMVHIAAAKSNAEIDEAVNQFRTGWEETRKTLEAARVKGVEDIIKAVKARLAETKAEEKLRSALESIRNGIRQLEAAGTGVRDAGADAKLRKLQFMLPLVEETLDLIDRFNEAKPSDDIKTLLELKDRLQQKLDALIQLGQTDIPVP